MEVNKTECPVCRVQLKEGNLKRHLKKVHNTCKEDLPQHDDAKPEKYLRVMYRCNQCHKKFGKAAAAKHLKDVHNFISQSPDNCHKYYFKETVVEVSRSPVGPVKKKSNKNSLALLQKASSDYVLLRRSLLRAMRAGNQFKLKRGKFIGDLSNVEDELYCSLCKRNVKEVNALKHFRKVHNWNLKKSEEYPVRVDKAVDVKEESPSPNEFFNDVRVVSGGAYGLGKNRKH